LLEWVKNSAWKWYFFLWFQIIFGAKKNPPLDTKCVKTSLTFEGSERNRIKSEGNVLRAKKIYLLLLYFLKLSRKKNILRRPIEIYLYVREFSIFWFVKAWRIEKKRLNISSVLAALVSIIQSLKRIHLIWKIWTGWKEMENDLLTLKVDKWRSRKWTTTFLTCSELLDERELRLDKN